MTQTKVMNRWQVVIGGILIQLCLGSIYAWSAFTKELTEAGLTKTQTQIIFSTGLVSFAVVMALIAGKWQKKAGPRKVAIAGGLVLGLGYMLAGFSGTHDNPSFWGILLGIGLLGGTGIGLGYVCPIVALVKWFPDKKGMITGLAVAGFGFGALIWIKLTTGFEFGPINLTPGWEGLYGMGWTVNEVFKLYGLLFAILVIAGAQVLVNPPDNWQPVTNCPVQNAGHVELTARQMMRTPQFWILFLTFSAGGMAGLEVIGNIQLFGIDALTAKGVVPAEANSIVSTAMGLFYALLNGLGRIVWGVLSDKTGRKNAIVLMSASQGIMLILFYFIGSYEIGLYLGAALIGFNFGGNFALFPAATADYFGNKNVGTNYPWVYMAYGVGGVIGPILGGIMGDAGAWLWAFVPAGIACLAAAALSARLRPVHPSAHALSLEANGETDAS
jgi:OFA family oxalate/formate antiporter-like MFS transporter